MENAKSILIIEDDADLSKLIALHVNEMGLSADTASDGRSGLKKATTGNYGLVVLDVMLPGLDGYEVCRGIRKVNTAMPIIMLTAKKEELDKVLGLELGADDYVTKPFGVRELMARVRALLRRAEGKPRAAAAGSGEMGIRIGEISVDFAGRRVEVSGTPVELTAKEFDLLATFVRNPGRAFSRSQLLEQVWGYTFEGYDHTVNSHINRLRAKIERDPGRPEYLRTVWGIGYRFAEPQEAGK
jgi:two-component system alkaline phosphatase synthesis response regulator PhoP